ncbi:MAG TPA: glycosyltransferase family 39 protein [Clostridiaceae bacterium]|nr:glycosyltransferase family 39 protein [Clostridiaceae bacterium]
MKRKNTAIFFTGVFTGLSFIIKLCLIFYYKNNLTLSSDDINYIKSAVALLKGGIFVFHQYNEPTVFVMPLYPLFLAGIFKVFGYGLAGLQAARVIQAILSSISVLLVYLIAEELFDKKIAVFSTLLVALYFPNIVTSGYFLTETLFTTLLLLLIFFSLSFSGNPTWYKFALLGFIWTLSVLCRPTIALFPLFLFIYLLFYKKIPFAKIIKCSLSMGLVFFVIMLPWWIRNYSEYGEFIPLSASGGNPMLQGTYVDYKQTPENIVYYKLGSNAFETNKVEVKIARNRIIEEFKRDFFGYLNWFTLGKTKYLWYTPFYWKEFFGMKSSYVTIYHYFLLTGFIGIIILIVKSFSRYFIPISIIFYFNIVHCVYMAFDRYAFPLMPLVSIFCAFSIISVYRFVVVKFL